MVVDIVVSLALYKPLGIAGLIIGTVAANVVMTALQVRRLRIGFNGRLEGAQTTMITARILVASALLAAVSWVVWYALDALLGRSLLAQIVSVGGAGAAGPAGVHARGARDARPRGPPGQPPDPHAGRFGDANEGSVSLIGRQGVTSSEKMRTGRAKGPPGRRPVIDRR